MQQPVRKALVLAILGVLGTSSTARADTEFKAGSIIIPASASYQHSCGAVSMYGLIMNVLRANHNATDPIKVYYAYNPTKKSPNRCTPTNQDTGPAYLANGTLWAADPAPTHDNPIWTDGCDFTVSDLATADTKAPVTLVVNGTASNPASDGAVVTYTTVGNNYVFPQYTGRTIQESTTTTLNTGIVRYAGGSFIIADKVAGTTADDSDADRFLKLLDGTTTATDASGNPISFDPFKTPITAGVPGDKDSCTFGVAFTPPDPNPNTAGGYVRLHRATYKFSAPTPKLFTASPPRLALLATDTGTVTQKVSNNILQKYLRNAGLEFTGAVGCPPGSVNCGVGEGHGQIYDEFDFQDLVDPSNKLAETETVGTETRKVYGMLWAPHWESLADSDSPPTANEIAAIDHVEAFLDGKAGLMAECHSIGSFEGTMLGTALGPFSGPPDDLDAEEMASIPGQFMTCHKDAVVPTDCSSSLTYEHGLRKNRFSNHRSNGPCSGCSDDPADPPTHLGRGKNCTDPTLVENNNCIYYHYPGDGFAQPADFIWRSDNGFVADYAANSAFNMIYRPGTLNLISAVADVKRALLADNTTAAPMITTNIALRGLKDNDAAKSNILYAGGHDLSESVSGTKLILQTLLLLGENIPPTTTIEVARSTPIVATVGGFEAIVQGTYEVTTPTPEFTSVSSGIDVYNFQFPYARGHMRAIKTTDIDGDTTGDVATVDLEELETQFTPVLETQIPDPTYTGCTSKFGGTCRTIFTNLVTGFNPAMVDFEWPSGNDADTDPLALAVAPTLDNTSCPNCRQTIVERVLAGVEDPNAPGDYKPVLGGVDRSTVAVIPASLAAGFTRPTMIYFGAQDGMLHAVCAQAFPADTSGGTDPDLFKGNCDVVGRELWAFIPRTQLPKLKENLARIEGSPRVIDLLGDFTGSGIKKMRTILLFQTGSGKPGTIAEPATYALDITNPANPIILWDFVTPGPGLTLTVGKVVISGVSKNIAFIQTNSGSTAGTTLRAVDIETGTQLWEQSLPYPAARSVGIDVPATGIPGGAIAITRDNSSSSNTTDVLIGTLYGDIWRFNPIDGVNPYTLVNPPLAAVPLFRFTTDQKPFGAAPTLYGNGADRYVIAVSGGYTDLGADGDGALTPSAQWSGADHQAVGVNLSPSLTNTPPITELITGSDIPFILDLETGFRSFSQAIVIGGELFVTGDSTDVNASGYGTSNTDTGKLFRKTLGTGATGTFDSAVAIRGGAGSIGDEGTKVYAASSDQVEKISTNAVGTTGTDVGTNSPTKVTRRLWLQTL